MMIPTELASLIKHIFLLLCVFFQVIKLFIFVIFYFKKISIILHSTEGKEAELLWVQINLTNFN